MNESTNWGPGLYVLAAAAVVAIVFLLLSRRTKLGEVRPGTVDDLTARYNGLLNELKELKANKHLTGAEQYERDIARLEQAAAAILRERDGVKHETTKAAAREEKKAVVAAQATGLFAQSPGLKGGLIGALVVGFFIFLGLKLSDSTKPRGEGESATGGNLNAKDMPPGMMGQGGQQQEEDPELTARLEAAQKNPENVDALVEAGMYLIGQQEFDAARPYLSRATGIDPYDVRGRVGRAVLLAVDGESKPALEELEHLANTYPEAWEARLYAGLIAREEKDNARALKQLEAFVIQAPASEQPPVVAQLIGELKAEMQKGDAKVNVPAPAPFAPTPKP